jgi:hypothetical protein
MALTPVPVPTFPDVPVAPGVPPVLRSIQATVDKVALLTADAIVIARMFTGPQWGIFLDGTPVLIGDSVVGVDYRHEWRVANYPVEKGGFASYNKVAEPFDIRVTFACSGSQSLISTILSGGALGALITNTDPAAGNRGAFMRALEQFGAGLDLLTVVTPEFTFPSCNITHIDYRREARKGATLILIDVWLVEIRVTGTAAFSSTAAASGAAPVDNGAVQPTTPPATVEPGLTPSSTGAGALSSPVVGPGFA